MRTVLEPPFEITETGWGEFELTIRIYFQDSSERPVTYNVGNGWNIVELAIYVVLPAILLLYKNKNIKMCSILRIERALNFQNPRSFRFFVRKKIAFRRQTVKIAEFRDRQRRRQITQCAFYSRFPKVITRKSWNIMAKKNGIA